MTLKEFEKKIHGIINDREKELEELNNKKLENENKINEVKSVINKAKVDNNFKKHNEAKKKLGELENEQEFYTARMEIVKSPIPHEEYFNYLDTLDEILGEEIDKVFEEFKPVLEQVENILTKERDIWVRAMVLGDLIKKELLNDSILSNGHSTSYRSIHKQKTYLAVEKCYYKHNS